MRKGKSAWRPGMNRYERMRAAWIDAMQQGTTRLPFAQFEERMLHRDLMIRKEEFEKRKIVSSDPLLKKAIRGTLQAYRRLMAKRQLATANN